MEEEKKIVEQLVKMRGGKSGGKLENCTVEELIYRCRALEQIATELVVSNNLYRRQLAHHIAMYHCPKCKEQVRIIQKFSGALLCKECGIDIAE